MPEDSDDAQAGRSGDSGSFARHLLDLRNYAVNRTVILGRVRECGHALLD